MEFWSPICSTTYYSVKKTIFYDFFPSKMVEEATCNEMGEAFQMSKQLIEIRDVHIPPDFAYLGIHRLLTDSEMHEGKIHLLHHVAFEHVFRFMPMCETYVVVLGNATGIALTIWDFTGYRNTVFDNAPSHKALFQRCPGGHYTLDISELIVTRRIRSGDEFLLRYSQRSSAFVFKLLGRNVIQIQ